MRFRPARAIVLIAVAALLAIPAAAGARTAPAADPASGTALVTDAILMPAGLASRPLPATASVELTLTLAYAHPATLAAFLSAVQQPGSAQYHRYLSASEFRAEFDPTPAERSRVASVLVAAGGTGVAVGPTGATVSATVPAAAVDRLFGVDLRSFGTVGREPIYTATGTPTLPPALAGDVVGIGGLSNAANVRLSLAARLAPAAPVDSARGGSSSFVIGDQGVQWMTGSDYTQLYGASDLFPGGSLGSAGRYPTSVAIATLLASSYNASTAENLPPWDPNVIDTYLNNTTAPAWPHSPVTGVPVPIANVTPPLPGFFGGLNDTSGFEFENSLDLEMAGDMAPGAPLYNFYFAGSLAATTAGGPLTDLADDFALDLATALNYTYPSGVQLGVVSGSFGLPDLNDSAWNAALQEAAATGVTVVMASGDQGNAPSADTGRGADGQWPTWPASATFNSSGAIAVGGVTVTADGVPTTTFNGTSLNVTFDSNLSGFQSMSAWYNAPGAPGSGDWAGSEGGLSTVVPEPAWQFHSAAQPAISAAAGLQGASFLGRAEPDVAFPANNTIAYVLSDAQHNLYFDVLAGTSVATPLFAGLLADEVAVLGHPLGFLDPTLYRMASYYQANGSSGDPFLGVTVGGNYVFDAGPGWNAVTGWGGLNAVLFRAALENATVTNFTYTGPTPGLPPPASTGPAFSVETVAVVLGLAVAAAIVLVLAFGRPRRSAGTPLPLWGPTGGLQPPGPWPPGHAGGPPLPPPPPGAAPLASAPATFQCPYCGAPRPAEPVRCPHCGVL